MFVSLYICYHDFLKETAFYDPNRFILKIYFKHIKYIKIFNFARILYAFYYI